MSSVWSWQCNIFSGGNNCLLSTEAEATEVSPRRGPAPYRCVLGQTSSPLFSGEREAWKGERWSERIHLPSWNFTRPPHGCTAPALPDHRGARVKWTKRRWSQVIPPVCCSWQILVVKLLSCCRPGLWNWSACNLFNSDGHKVTNVLTVIVRKCKRSDRARFVCLGLLTLLPRSCVAIDHWVKHWSPTSFC